VVEEIKGEFLIVGYVDDIEDAVMNAEKKNMPQELINDMNTIHGDIVELESFLVDQEDYDSLTEAVAEPINDLVEKCREGDTDGVRKVVDKLGENVIALRKDLMD